MEAAFIVATIVGLMEISPGVCQMDLLNPDGSIYTSTLACEHVVADYVRIHGEFPSEWGQE